MSSEITRLIQEIDREAIAMQRGLYGLASTARHEFISHKYKAIDTAIEKLETLIGPDAWQLANDLIESATFMVTMEQRVNQKQGASNV